MDQLKRFFKEAATYTFFDFLRRVLGFFLIPFYTRYLTPTEYGIYFLILLVTGFLAILYNLGLMVSLYRYQPREKNSFLCTITFLIPYNLILTIVLLIAAGRISQFFLHSEKFAILFQIGFLFLFFEGFLNQALALYKVERMPYYFGLLSTLRFATGLFFNILLVVVLRKGVYGILLGNLLASVVIASSIFFLVGRYLKGKFDADLLMREFSYSLPLLPALWAFFLIDYIDRFMVERFLGLSAVGIYSLAYQIGSVINLAVLGFRAAYPPFFFSLKTEELGNLGRIFQYFVLLVGFLYIVLIMALPEVFPIFIGSRFHPASSLVWMIALSFLFYGIYINFASHLYLQNRTGVVSLLALGSLAANIIGNLILIPPLGSYGAAVATIISYLLLALLAYLVTRPDYDLSLLLKVLTYIAIATLLGLFQVGLIFRLLTVLVYPILFWWLKRGEDEK
ncbi:hypothetical protein DRP53_07895 [candidate division WOR-3 bacterium]|uniref:Uncharacterized protein n=1 Tax=candidate division WOR-3 bacterium TaxID=2052148 RepID=A0A660SHP8_UNCW3|nr:MAG: hypothetical protein DRP53_07895 [candidate division WOR-3 bacterium]